MTKSRGLIAKRGARQAWMAEQQGRHFCRCGCGAPIPLRLEHYSQGVPSYLLGHNSRADHPRAKPKPPQQPCGCGCGELAGPGKRYVSGHNGRGRRRPTAVVAKIAAANRGKRRNKPAWNAKPKPDPLPCACGCGQLATPGRQFVSGHNGRGQRLPNYRGWYEHLGYIYRHAPDHPYANPRGYIFEHRLVMEAHLREAQPDSPHLIRLGDQLYLRREVIVHHLDGAKANNDLANLVALTPGDHTRLHHEQGDIRH